MPIRILFACGGTAGHINPALAVAGVLKKKHPDTQILFAGNPKGMEARLVSAAGYDFAPIHVLGFQRKLTLHNLKNNVMAAAYLLTASQRAAKIIRDFSPNVCMGTGGYVSGPVVRQAAKMGIPTLTHEQNAFPGVTTKLLTRYVDKVLLAVPEAMDYLPPKVHDRCVITGNPVRQEILLADRKAARQKMGIGDRICLLSFGGSLGAQQINQSIADVMAWHAGKGRIHHIHATGQYGVELFPRLLRERGVNPQGDPHLDIRTYIDDMPDCLAAADLVICRSGAISLSELQAAGKASILIPSPNVAENHQYHNAMVMVSKNAALIIEEKDLTGARLIQVIEDVISDPQELRNIGKNAASMAIIDSAERICSQIEELIS